MNPTEETELLSPCPWCQKNPESSQDVDEVYCFNPHCALFRFTMSAEDWNTRTPPPFHQPSNQEFNCPPKGHLLTPQPIEMKSAEESGAKYCKNPDDCTYVDCPTAFCDKHLASVRPSQPSLNVEKAVEEIYSKYMAHHFSLNAKDGLKQILTRHFTEAQPSQLTGEQIQEIVEKGIKQLQALLRDPNAGNKSAPSFNSIIKQAILSALALRK